MYHGVLPYTGSYMNVLHAESERCWKMLKVARFGTLSKSVKQDQTSASQVSPSEAPYSNWLDVAAACGLAWRCMEHLQNFIIVSKGSNSEKTHGFRIYRISEKIRSCMTLQTVTFITWGCIKLCDLPCRLIQPVNDCGRGDHECNCWAGPYCLGDAKGKQGQQKATLRRWKKWAA